MILARSVIPALAGIYSSTPVPAEACVPASAGMTFLYGVAQ
jgi:hypothetical protein